MKDQDLIIIEKKKKKIQVVFALVLSLIVVLFIGKSLADLLENGSEVTPNTQLTYYLDVSYDGIDKNGVQSGDTVVSEVRSGLLYVEDKLPEGLIFNGFVTTSDGSIGAVKRSDSTVLCTGKVVDDTHDASTSTGTWNSGNTEYTYHGLHYDANTRTVTFQVENLQAGCKLTVGIITTTPPIDDPNTVEEEVRRDFYNFATSREKDLIVNSNTVHSFMKKSSSTISSFYNVSYQYTGTVPSNAPSVPATTAYVEGAKVGVASPVQLDGYTFSGWSSSTTGVNVSNGSFSMPGRDVVFTGSFTANPTYNVTYSLTGTTPNGYTLPLQKSYYPNSVVDVDNLKVGDVIGGYRFLGWTPTTSGVVVDSNGQFIMPNSAVSFTGSFELVTYSVSYEFYDTVLPPNSDNYLPSSQTYTPGDTVSLSTVNAIPNGYDFLGWYHDDYFTMPSQNVVIYGEWRRSQQSGTFTPTIVKEFIDTDDYYHYGDTVQFRITVTNTASFSINNVLIRDLADGAYFSTGSGYTVVSSSIVNINTINANGSFSLIVNYPLKSTDIGTITNTAEIVSASPDSNHSGYTLTEGDYTASDTFTASSSHTVTYSLIGTTPSGYTLPTSSSQYPGHSVVVDSMAVGDVVNGYRFLGWSSTDVTISNGEFVMPNNNVTIIGEFEEITYTLTYQFDNSVLPPNSALYLPANQRYSAGSQVSLETINSPNGYEFMGWTSNDVTITNNEFIMPEANVTVTGTWRETGTFEPTISKTIVSPQSYYNVGDIIQFNVTVNNTANFAIENVVLKEFLDGAEFVSGNGYTLLQDGSIRISSIAANSSATVTASYTVTSLDTGTVINTVKLLSANAENSYGGYTLYDKEYAATAAIPIQSKLTLCKEVAGADTGNHFQFHVEEINHVFDTWIVLDDNECTTISLEPGTYNILEVVPQEYNIQSVTGSIQSNNSNFVVQAGNNYSITFTNQFIRKNYLHSSGRVENTIDNVLGITGYTITYHSNGGNGNMDDQTIEFGASEALTPNEFTHNSLNFAYWNTKADGTGTIYHDEEVVTDLGDSEHTTVDLYAQWVSGVAMIGDTVYSTLADAINAINNDSTATSSTQRVIKLLADTTDNVTLNTGKNILLNLNGHTVTGSTGFSILINNGTATITNGTFTYNDSSSENNAAINNYGTLVVDSARVEMLKTNGKQAIYNDGGTVTIQGDSEIYCVSTIRGAVQNHVGTVIITGGTIESTLYTAVVNDSNSGNVLRIGELDGVITPDTPVIQGGVPTGTSKFYGVDNNATTIYYDGTVRGVTSAFKAEANVTKAGYTAIYHENVVIDGTTYDSTSIQERVVVTFNVEGGTCSEAEREFAKGAAIGTLPVPTRTNYVFDGWFYDVNGQNAATANDIFTENDDLYAHWTHVNDAVYVRNVTTGVGYKTMSAALAAVSTGDTLRLERNLAETFTLASGKKIILDAGNCTLSTTSGNLIVNNGDLTIIGGTFSSTAQAGVINNNNGGVLTITGGTINAYNRAAVYNIDGGTVNISGGTFTSIATGAVNNMNRATLQNLAGGTMTVTGGDVINTADGPGVSNKGNLTIGDEDGNISTTEPMIRGKTYGVYNYSGSTFNFYDGIMKGGTGTNKGPYYGTVTDQEDGTTFANGSEVIDGTTYSTAYLN